MMDKSDSTSDTVTWADFISVIESLNKREPSDEDAYYGVLKPEIWEAYQKWNNRWYRRLWRWLRG